jgi:ferric-dicitrate binding protein FerR (iron transport regulator)
MKKILIVCVVLFLAAILSAETVALLSASKGDVKLERANKAVNFKNGDLLQNRDVIRTGPESFAAYKYIDASSLIKLFSNSVVTIHAEQADGQLSKRVNVSQGSVLSSIKSGTGAFTVQTPTTVASVKGTEFMTRVDEGGNSIFIVTEGEVELRVLVTDEMITVSKGRTAIIDPDHKSQLRDSNEDDISSIESAELDSSRETQKSRLIIPVLDEAGNTKHIEITF